MAGRRVSSRGENVAEVVRLDRGAERSFAECRGAFQPCDFGGRVRTMTRMHGLTKNWIEIFHFLKNGRKCRFLVGSFIWAGVFSSLHGLLSRSFFWNPSADTSARRPASKRGEDRTAGRAIGYIIITSTFVSRPLPFISSEAFRLFAHSRAKTARGRVPPASCRPVDFPGHKCRQAER